MSRVELVDIALAAFSNNSPRAPRSGNAATLPTLQMESRHAASATPPAFWRRKHDQERQPARPCMAAVCPAQPHARWYSAVARCDGAVNAKLSNRFVIPGLCPLFDRWDAHPTLAVLDCTHPCYDSNVMAAMVEPLLWNHPLDGAATATAAQLEVACVPPSIISFGTGRAPGPVRFCSERLAPSGEERTRDTSAQVERAALCFRHSDSGTHAWCGHATVMVLVSSASGPRVRAAAPTLRDILGRTP